MTDTTKQSPCTNFDGLTHVTTLQTILPHEQALKIAVSALKAEMGLPMEHRRLYLFHHNLYGIRKFRDVQLLRRRDDMTPYHLAIAMVLTKLTGKL